MRGHSKWLLILCTIGLVSCFDDDDKTAKIESTQLSRTNSEENLLTDDQLKTIQHNAQALLKGRRLQQDAQTEASQYNKRQLRKLQGIVQTVEHDFSRLQFKPVYRPQLSHVGTITEIPDIKFVDAQEPIAQINTGNRPLINSTQAAYKEKKKREREAILRTARLSIQEMKTTFIPRSKISLFSVFETKQQNQNTAQRELIVAKIREVEQALTGLEASGENALQKIRQLNNRIRFRQPELRMKDTQPTVTFTHSPDNTNPLNVAN